MPDDLLGLLLGCGCKKTCCCQKPTPAPPTSGGNLFRQKGKGSPAPLMPDDPPFVPPRPVTREVWGTVAPQLPGAGLRRGNFRWTVTWGDGWENRGAELPEYASLRGQGAGAIRAADGGALAAFIYPDAIPNIQPRLYHLPAGWKQGDDIEQVIIPPPFTHPNDPVQGGVSPDGGVAYRYAAAVTTRPGLLRLTALIVSAVSFSDWDEANPVDLLVCSIDVHADGVVPAKWRIFPWQYVTSWRPDHVLAIRTVGSTDGTLYINVLDHWYALTDGGLNAISAPPPAGPLRTAEFNPLTQQDEILDLPWQLSLPPGGEEEPGGPEARTRGTPGVTDGAGRAWATRETLRATVTRVTRLSGGLTLLTLDGLPSGLTDGWLGVPGRVVPWVPGLLSTDPDGLIARTHPPGSVITWDGTQVTGAASGAEVVTQVEPDETGDPFYGYRGAAHHPLDRPDRVPLWWPYINLGWLHFHSVPEVTHTPAAQTGREVYPLTITASNDPPLPPDLPARLTVPALAPRLTSRAQWTVPAGTHTLTVTWPAVTARDTRVHFAVNTDWAAVRGGRLTLRVHGLSIPAPPRGGWLQLTRRQPHRGAPFTLEVTFTPPAGRPDARATVRLAQLSLTTTE